MSGRKSRERRKQEPSAGRGPQLTRFKPYTAVPPWAHFLTLDELHAFHRAVERALWARICWFEDEGAIIRVHRPDGTVTATQLAHVATLCSSVPVGSYLAVVEEHFARLFGDDEDEDDEDDPEITLQAVSKHVKLRIYTDAWLEKNSPKGADPLIRRLAKDLNATVVIDYPHLAMAFPRELLEKLKTTKDEVFKLAIENHRTDVVERAPFRFHDAEGFCLLSGSRYLSAQLLHLPRHLGQPAPWGALFTLTSRDELVCCPIDPRTLSFALIHLVGMTHSAFEDYKDDPDSSVPMSPEIYWWRPDRIVHIPSRWDDEFGAVVMPEEEFLETIFGTVRPNQLGGKLPV